MTVGDVRLWLEDKTVSRNISDDSVYGAASSSARRTGLDHHIQTVLNHFIRKTRCTRTVDDFTMESAQYQFDTSLEIPAFRSDLLLDCWIDGQDPVACVDDSVVRRLRADDPREGCPTHIGFVTPTEFIADGDRVVVLSTCAFRHRGSGKVAESPKADVYRFRDGQIVEFFEFFDTAAAFAATRSD